MAQQDKKNRLEPKLPRGFADRGPADIRAVEAMLRTIRGVYERYGFEPVETPFVEYTESLGKFLPDQDRPNEGVFSFQDDDEQWLSLRYDLTAPLARHVAENFDRLPKPYRSYRSGWVFRNEKPGPGRFRQFMQFDADTVGAPSVAADAEMCMMMADTLEALGIPRGQYVVRVNNRKVLDGVMEAIGLTDPAQKLTVLRAIDKLDRLGLAGVVELLGVGRKDESGDFTKGAGLDAAQIATVRGLLDEASEGADQRAIIAAADLALAQIEIGQTGVSELEEISRLVTSAGYGSDRIRIDTTVVRGLEYYTGPVFEAELLFETVNDKGEPARFGSVGGGGRYDGLVGRFRGEDVPATGFSIGVSRLAAALKALGKLGEDEISGPVVVTVMDKTRLPDYQKLVTELRDGLNKDRGPNDPIVPVEMYLGGSGMKAQLKYADRRNAPCAIIAGSNEFAAGRLQVKDLAAGKEQAAAIADNQTWRDERPGQFEIAASDVVAEVKALLARQRGG